MHSTRILQTSLPSRKQGEMPVAWEGNWPSSDWKVPGPYQYPCVFATGPLLMCIKVCHLCWNVRCFPSSSTHSSWLSSAALCISKYRACWHYPYVTFRMWLCYSPLPTEALTQLLRSNSQLYQPSNPLHCWFSICLTMSPFLWALSLIAVDG